MHPGQLRVSAELVAALVAEQLPAWSGLPVRALETAGTVSAVFRLGDEMVVHLPLRPGDPEAQRSAYVAEAANARRIAGVVPVPCPTPLAIGDPGRGFPMPWTVSTWVPGDVATPDSHASSAVFAHDLVAVIRALRDDDTGGAVFDGNGRGGDLRSHDDWVQECLGRSASLLDTARLAGLWAAYRELPRTAPDVMSHRDLIPGNVVVAGERIAGLLDVGAYGPADPALDLVAAWHLLDAPTRTVLRDELGCDDLEWARGRAWAFEQAIGLVWYYRESNPLMSGLGRRTLERIVESHDGDGV